MMARFSASALRFVGALMVLAAACSAEARPARSPDGAAPPAQLPVATSRVAPDLPDPRPTADSTCKPKRRLHAEGAWARKLDRAIGTHAVGVAVGVRRHIVYGHDARRPRVPASNQKLLLSMALLDVLGSDHRIATRVAAKHVKGTIVAGDLWLIGAGDPTLSARSRGYWGGIASPTLRGLASRIARSGITEVQGRVFGARGFFAHDLNAPGWQPYVPGRYVQLPAALIVDGNNSGDAEPERAAAQVLTKELRHLGVTISGKAGSGRPPGDLTTVATVRSRPLSEILGYMNRTSNNFFAEMLAKLLGAEKYGPPGTIAKGARTISAWAGERAVVARAKDGSGLSYSNRISPQGLVRLLSGAARESWGEDLRRSLPGAGEGTLRSRLYGLQVHAKTGTLFNGASTLSGWVRSRVDGRWISFSILGRNIPKALEDRIVRAVSELRVGATVLDC
jgi:D-alanyl-D-alanine carboxypeptidase/D-alanyl-D-alanine-endopeptidase (penicillin-binding protein 4)